MPIDPRIALGVQPLQVADPMARYSQLAGIQNAQNQNALAQYQLSAAQRADEQQNKLYAAAQKPDFKLDFQSAIQYGAPGMAAYKAQQEASNAQTEGQIKSTKLLTDKLALLPEAYKRADTPEAYLALHQSIHADPVLGPYLKSVGATPEKGLTTLQNAIQTGNFEKLRMGSMQSVSQILDSLKPMAVAASSSVYDPQTGTFKQAPAAPKEVTPTEIKKLTAERDALPLGHPNRKLYDQAIANLGSTERLAQERLNFDRSKFAWEKANPGYTIQQAEDGSIVGVNNRTLQYFPVTLGGTSPPPAAPFGGGGAPAPGGAGKRGGAVTPVAEPIIQPRGAPLKGKSAGLTESQGNATAFGLRMQESHSTLKDLESKGETGTGVIGGTVGGVVGLVPLIGDKLTAGVDNIYNVLPQVMGGYSPEQQKIMNGRINFITAVLRKESGAAISPGEFVTAEKLYFPRPGDDPSVIKQKQRARELAIKAMKIQAGPGAKSIEETTPSESGATSASDPLGLFNK